MKHILYSVRLPYLEHINLSATRAIFAALWQGLPRNSLRRLLGNQQHIALEIIGTQAGISYAIGLPSNKYLHSFKDQMLAHFPSCSLEETEEFLLPNVASSQLEIGPALTFEESLYVPKTSDVDPLSGVLSALTGVGENQLASVQILVRPATNPELVEPSFEVVIRILTQGENQGWRQLQLSRLLLALGPFAGANRLKQHSPVKHSKSVPIEYKSRYWPMYRFNTPVMSIHEITSLYHFPDNRTARMVGIPVDTSLNLSLNQAPSSEGVAIGKAKFRGKDHIVRISAKDLSRHTMLLGASGSGKSTMMNTMLVDYAKAGGGFTLLDPAGDLVTDIIATLPVNRLDDVILLKFSDTEYPVGLNIIGQHSRDSQLVASEFVEVIKRIYGGSYWGPQLDVVLSNAALAASEVSGTVIDVARLLDDESVREGIADKLSNGETRRFWKSFGGLGASGQDKKADATLTRLQKFLSLPLMKNIVGQQTTKFDPRKAMDQGKIVLVDLSGIGVNNIKLLGSMLLTLYFQAALSRVDIPESERRFHLFPMDESHQFLSLTLAEMSDQVRKYKLGLCPAAQRLSQIKPDELKDAIFANFGNIISFTMNEHSEATYIAKHLNTPGLSGDEIRSLPAYHAYAQILFSGTKSQAFSLESLPPLEKGIDAHFRYLQVLHRSRALYAQPREIVEDQLEQYERRWIEQSKLPEITVLEAEEYPILDAS